MRDAPEETPGPHERGSTEPAARHTRGRAARRVRTRTTLGTRAREPVPGRARTAPAGRAGRDRGQAAVEYLGFLPVLLLVGLAGLQLGVAAYAAQQAGTAARAAARAAVSEDEGIDARAVGYASAAWAENVAIVPEGDRVVATVTVRVPRVVPFWDFDDVRKTVTMPMTDEEDRP